MKKLIFGCGYLGKRVAARWVAEGAETFGVTRSLQNVEAFQRIGVRGIVADLTKPETLRGLPSVEVVLFAVGYDRANVAGQSIHEVYVDGLRNVLEALPETVRRVIYVSSTGVYGNVTGEWVDEDSPCQPTREGGQACLAAERLLAESKWHERSIVLRLAGIYGPDRIPMRKLLAAGQPLAVPSEGALNLIHVDDAAGVVSLAEKLAVPPRTYVVSDGHPVIRGEYYRHLAELINAPPARFETPPPGSPAAARAGSDKRVNNSRLVRELAPRFQFPSYREGLAAIVRDEDRGDS